MVFPCFLTKRNYELMSLGAPARVDLNAPWIHSDRPVLLLLCHGGLLRVVDGDRWGSETVRGHGFFVPQLGLG